MESSKIIRIREKYMNTKNCMNHSMGRIICDKDTCDGVPFEHVAHCIDCKEAIRQEGKKNIFVNGNKMSDCPNGCDERHVCSKCVCEKCRAYSFETGKCECHSSPQDDNKEILEGLDKHFGVQEKSKLSDCCHAQIRTSELVCSTCLNTCSVFPVSEVQENSKCEKCGIGTNGKYNPSRMSQAINKAQVEGEKHGWIQGQMHGEAIGRKEGYEKGLHDEASRWMNQDANEHDKQIRTRATNEDKKKRSDIMKKVVAVRLSKKSNEKQND